MPVEKCEDCGRFGARKYVEDKGPNGLGGRQTETRYLCDACEDRYRVWRREQEQEQRKVRMSG